MNNRKYSPAVIRFNVNPRYTPGSPALVDSTTAERLARQERDSYERVIAGVYGETKKEQARRLGLRGIVEETWEFRGILMYRDVLTGETGAKPVCEHCGKRHATGQKVGETYEPHPEELKYHPELDSDYWAPSGG